MSENSQHEESVRRALTSEASPRSALGQREAGTPEQQEIYRLNGIIRSQNEALNHWRKAYDGAHRETAEQAAQCAASLADSYDDQFCAHAIGAMSASCAIRRRFGLSAAILPIGPDGDDVFADVTDAVADHYLQIAEDAGLKVERNRVRSAAWYKLRGVIAEAFTAKSEEPAHA